MGKVEELVMSCGVCGKDIGLEGAGLCQECMDIAVEIENEASVVEMVDEYIAVNRQIRELEKRMKELRGGIEEYMEDNNMDEIGSSEGDFYLERKAVNRAITTSNFTTYLVDDVVPYLDAATKEMVIQPCVNKDILEALVKSKVVDKKAIANKQQQTSIQLGVKKVK